MSENRAKPGKIHAEGNKCESFKSNKSNLSVDAPVFYPKNFTEPISSNSEGPVENLMALSLDQPVNNNLENALQVLREAVHLLTIDPGNFESMAPSLVHRLAFYVQDEKEMIQYLADELFHQSIDEVNFRYTGARLCNFLAHRSESTFRNFKKEFISRCTREFEVIMAHESKIPLSHTISYSLFLGELLVNLKNSSNDRLNPEFLDQLSQLIPYLLEHNCKEAILSVVQLLKLTGAVLEGNLSNMNEIFNKINILIKSSSLPRNLEVILDSVCKQRENNWGQNYIPSSSRSQKNNLYSQSSERGPQNHGNNGEDEEDQVNSVHLTSSGAGDSLTGDLDAEERNDFERSVDQYYIGDQAMDDETACAFEQFIAEQQLQQQH